MLLAFRYVYSNKRWQISWRAIFWRLSRLCTGRCFRPGLQSVLAGRIHTHQSSADKPQRHDAVTKLVGHASHIIQTRPVISPATKNAAKPQRRRLTLFGPTFTQFQKVVMFTFTAPQECHILSIGNFCYLRIQLKNTIIKICGTVFYVT